MKTRSGTAIEVDDLPSDPHVPTLEELYETLANRRRRFAIHYLQYHEKPVPLGTLAEQLAAWEHGSTVEAVTSKQRKATYTSLQQRHLPKMDAAGLVEFDRRQGLVTPTDALSEMNIYTEIVSGREFPWSHYYLGLSAVVAAVVAAVWAGVYPFTLLPSVAWQVLCVTAFAASSLVHVYLTRRMKLGNDVEPPELRDRPTAASTQFDGGTTEADGGTPDSREAESRTVASDCFPSVPEADQSKPRR
jgi:hypothetical protein